MENSEGCRGERNNWFIYTYTMAFHLKKHIEWYPPITSKNNWNFSIWNNKVKYHSSNNNHNEDTYFQTKQSIEALYFARPDVTVKFVFAVCFGTGILTTTPSANIFAPKTLFTWKICTEKINGYPTCKWIAKWRMAYQQENGYPTCKISNLNVHFYPGSTKFLDGWQYFEGKINSLSYTIPAQI